jgi:hypothetical protein
LKNKSELEEDALEGFQTGKKDPDDLGRIKNDQRRKSFKPKPKPAPPANGLFDQLKKSKG